MGQTSSRFVTYFLNFTAYLFSHWAWSNAGLSVERAHWCCFEDWALVFSCDAPVHSTVQMSTYLRAQWWKCEWIAFAQYFCGVTECFPEKSSCWNKHVSRRWRLKWFEQFTMDLMLHLYKSIPLPFFYSLIIWYCTIHFFTRHWDFGSLSFFGAMEIVCIVSHRMCIY